MMNQLNGNITDTVKNYEMLDLANTINEEMNIYARESRGLAAHPPKELKKQFEQNKEQATKNVTIALESLKKLDTHEQSRQLILKLQALSKTYNEMNQEIIRLKEEGNNEKADQIYWYDSRKVREEMHEVSNQLQTIKKQMVNKELNSSRQTRNLATKMIVAYLIVGLLIGIGVTILILRSIISNLSNITSVMTKVAYNRTNKFPRLKVTSKDEIGEIAVSFNEMAQSLEKYIIQEAELKKAAEEQSWLKTKVAEIATMYSDIDDLETLAYRFITKVTPMVGANYGVFYIKLDNGNERVFRKFAAYAYDHERIGKESFHLGEGLVGQCALDKRMFLLNQVPKEHIKISSGIGSASPSDILIIPAEFQGEVLAVIELASFRPFTNLEQLLLKELMSTLGTNITSILRHMQVEKLLQESQAYAEELQTQSEELQLQQEELRVMNEQLEEQYKTSTQKSIELEEIKSILLGGRYNINQNF